MPTDSKPLTVALTGLAGSKVESSRPRQLRTNSRVCIRCASKSSKSSHTEVLSPSTSTHTVRCIVSANSIVQSSPPGTYRRPKQKSLIYRPFQLSILMGWSEKTYPNDEESDSLQPVVPRSRPPCCAEVSKVGCFETFELGAMGHCADRNPKKSIQGTWKLLA